MKCQKCGTEAPEYSLNCPECGHCFVKDVFDGTLISICCGLGIFFLICQIILNIANGDIITLNDFIYGNKIQFHSWSFLGLFADEFVGILYILVLFKLNKFNDYLPDEARIVTSKALMCLLTSATIIRFLLDFLPTESIVFYIIGVIGLFLFVACIVCSFVMAKEMEKKWSAFQIHNFDLWKKVQALGTYLKVYVSGLLLVGAVSVIMCSLLLALGLPVLGQIFYALLDIWQIVFIFMFMRFVDKLDAVESK
ncbi:MAG: hypothetical protein IK013_04540 [Bacteroidales bacterium]|nr:hypothetical protein [Bacteroidales bacterium]